MLSPDWVSVHHHNQIVQRLGQLRGQLGLLLEWLLPGEVEDVFLRDKVVDNCYTVVVPNEGSHPCNPTWRVQILSEMTDQPAAVLLTELVW